MGSGLKVQTPVLQPPQTWLPGYPPKPSHRENENGKCHQVHLDVCPTAGGTRQQGTGFQTAWSNTNPLRFTLKLGRQWEGASRAHGKWDRVRVGGGTAPTDGTLPVATLQTLAVVCKSQIGLQGAGYMPSNPQIPKIYWTD